MRRRCVIARWSVLLIVLAGVLEVVLSQPEKVGTAAGAIVTIAALGLLVVSEHESTAHGWRRVQP